MSVIRITAACPEALRHDANQLAMVLGYGPADAKTYTGLGWKDAQDNLYAAASFEARQEWVTAAQGQLLRPVWDTENLIDMIAAKRAQAAMVFWVGNGSIPQGDPSLLVSVGGMSGTAALSAMGLTPVPSEI